LVADAEHFAPDKRKRDGLVADCRECRRKRGAVYRAANVEKERVRHTLYRDEHRDEIRAKTLVHDNAHRVEKNARNRARYAERHDEELARSRSYRLAHRDRILAAQTKYRSAHREELRAKNCDYWEKNKERLLSRAPKPVPEGATKTCPMCDRTLPATPENFSPNPLGKYGMQARCKRCVAEQAHAKYLSDPNLARQRAREWAEAHREEVRVRSRALYAADPKRHIAYALTGWHNRRARKAAAGGHHTTADVRAQYARQRGRCYWCGRRVGEKYHVDHVIPLAKGGTNGPENLVIACPSCNCSKGARHPMEWAGRLC
jgi:5-methylcytosine-specific restriction endonuclease McrA